MVNNLAPSAPSESDANSDTVGENAAEGTTVGITVSGSTDPAGGSVTYVLADDAGGRFQISGGVVTVLDGSQIDFESSGGSYSITIVATDGNLNSTELTKTIFVADAAPSDPVDSDETDNLVEQNVATGTPLGVVASASDPAGGNVTFIMTDTAGGRLKAKSAFGHQRLTQTAAGTFVLALTALSSPLMVGTTNQ